MKILITGHKGFIGQNFLKKLDSKKNTVYGLDIKDKSDCKKFFSSASYSFDLVIHCAAIIKGRETIDNNPLVIAENLAIDSSLFTWAIKAKPKQLVYFSSSAVYPVSLQTKERKLKESDVVIKEKNSFDLPDKIYGWSKLTGELLANYYADNYNGKVYIFRPFSGYGNGQDIDYPFPAFIRRAKKKENPFIIWGTGKQVRDFIHIEDILNATFAAIKNNITQPINLGTGIPTSFTSLAKMITKKAGYLPKFSYLEEKPTGVSYRVADITRLKKFYTPKISLEEGIKKALS
ncbi:MAG TPA: NAD(P)-dependent oxidoreductase [Patescibacteria group bacterium]